MNIYYDSQTRKWFQCVIDEKSPHQFGHNGLIFYSHSPTDITARIGKKDQKLGPLIGILTGRNKKGSLSGNGSLFKSIQQSLFSLGGCSFVFSMEDVQDHIINGWLYCIKKNEWKRASFPFPDVVYNRIPFRTIEQKPSFFRFKKLLKGKKIPFFNPHFVDKWSLYNVLSEDPWLNKYLPKTVAVENEETLDKFFNEQHDIYLKPRSSAKGKGIYRLRRTENGILKEGLKSSKRFKNFSSFWTEHKNRLLRKKYIAQTTVQSVKLNNKRFDLRIIAHLNNGKYVISGIGIRQSGRQEVTTHVPSGGKLLPYSLIQTEKLDDWIAKLVQKCGTILTKKYGLFGEFSVDAGISDDSKFIIYEVNAKPMSFDEESIERYRLKHLSQLFFELSGFEPGL